MVIDWSAAIPIALGGAASGLVGIVYSEFRNRREEQQTIKRWFEKATNYASQISEAVERYRDYSEASQLQSTCADIAPRIREHVLNAPQERDDELIQDLVQLRLHCEHVSEAHAQALSGGRTELNEQRVDELYTTANKIENKAEDAIKNLRWI